MYLFQNKSYKIGFEVPSGGTWKILKEMEEEGVEGVVEEFTVGIKSEVKT